MVDLDGAVVKENPLPSDANGSTNGFEEGLLLVSTEIDLEVG